jgi:hypothetical protein
MEKPYIKQRYRKATGRNGTKIKRVSRLLTVDARNFLLVENGVPDAKLLPIVSKRAVNASSKEAVATAILLAAKRRVMAKTLSKKELSDLMTTVRRAGFAEGYAQAKMDMALGEVGEVPSEEDAPEELDLVLPPSKTPNNSAVMAARTPDDGFYKTRTTVNTTKEIALDYIRSAAPRVVGPTEIKKNSEKALNIFISFGTLKRATDALVEAGEIEQVEASRWRYKPRAETAGLRSVK